MIKLNYLLCVRLTSKFVRKIFGQSSNVSDVNIQLPLAVISHLQQDLTTADTKMDLTRVDFSDIILNNVRNSNCEIVAESVVTFLNVKGPTRGRSR